MSFKPKAVLFDADGVLFDCCALHKDTLNRALKSIANIEISDDDHQRIFNGLPTRTKLEILSETQSLDRSLHKEIESLKQKLTLTSIPKNVRPNTELIDVLFDLKFGLDLTLAICSNARTKSVLKMVECAGIGPYIDLILGNESILHPKPFPDIYLLASKQLSVPMIDCVIVEDSHKGVVAAISAGPGLLIKVKGPEEVPGKLREILL